jgi:hypothetical protein
MLNDLRNCSCIRPSQRHQQIKFPLTVPLSVLYMLLHHTFPFSVQLYVFPVSPPWLCPLEHILFHYLDNILQDSFLCLSRIENTFF